jgi:hypothetical protein
MPSVSFGFLAPYTRQHPKKIAARLAVGAALKRGDLVRQPCEVCGDPEVHGHHPDYDKPLDVLWLCPFHHFAWQRRARALLNPPRNPTSGKILPPLPPIRRQSAKEYARMQRRARRKAA